MGLTRLQLEDRVLQYGYGELDRTRFTDFINQAYRDVLGRHRWSWNVSAVPVTLAAGTNTTTIAGTTYIFFGRLRPTIVGIREPDFVEWNNKVRNEFTRRAFDTTYRGTPSKYAVNGDTVYFNTFADIAYTYDAQIWPLPAYLTATSSEPIIPDADREVLVAGAIMNQCLRDKDYQGAKIWSELYESRISGMWDSDQMNTSETDLRIPMPGHYYGVFSGR